MKYYYGWNIVATTFMVQAIISGVSTFCFSLWVAPWMAEFDTSRSAIMAASSGSLLLSGLSAPVIGLALDRLPLRRFVLIGIALCALAFFLISQARAMWEIVVLYAVLVGSGLAMAGPMVGMVIAGKWFQKKRGLAIGIVATGIAAGGVVLPPLVTASLGSVGWRETFVFLAILNLLLIPLVLLVIRDAPAQSSAESSNAVADAVPAAEGDYAADWSSGEILRDRGFLVIAISLTPLSVIMYSILQNFAPIAIDRGFSGQTVSLFLSALSATMLVGKIAFGWLADHLNPRHLYWIAAAGLTAALGIILQGRVAFWPMLLASVLIGMASSSVLPLMGTTIGQRFGSKAYGRAMGLMYPLTTLSALGPILTGWIRDEYDSYGPALWFSLAVLLPIIPLMAALPKGPKTRPFAKMTASKSQSDT